MDTTTASETLTAAVTYATSSGPSSSTTYNAELNHVQTIQLIVFQIVFPPIICFGFVGNLINITVLTRRSMRMSTTNRYLTCLAVYDILYLLFALSMVLKHFPAIDSTTWAYAFYRAYIGFPLTDIASNTGVWLTVTFTVERYICVSYPLKGIVWCTVRRAKYIIILVCTLSAFITLPDFFLLKPTTKNTTVISATSNSSIQTWDNSATAFGKSPVIIHGYVYLNHALFTFLPLIILLVFNALLVKSLLKAARERCTMMSNGMMSSSTSASMTDLAFGGHGTGGSGFGTSSSDHRITVMLIVVSAVFLVCQVPQALLQVYTTFVGSPMTNRRRLANTFLNLLVVINCSVNFVLYSSLSTKFRHTFSAVFLGSRRRRSCPTAGDTPRVNYVPHPPTATAARLATGYHGHRSNNNLRLGTPMLNDARGRSPAGSPMFIRSSPRGRATAR